MSKKPLLLMVLDGWGINGRLEGNAILSARTPNFDRLIRHYPNTVLESSGLAVGLPAGQMGNSEVGHLNLGAGRIVYQEFTRISEDIKSGRFFENEELVEAVRRAREGGKALHLMGLLSDGGVHSHIDHLIALLKLSRKEGLDKVYVHAFLDGRDVPPANAAVYIERLEKEMAQIGVGRIATIAGRYYAMDRDRRWERTEKAYNAMVLGEGLRAESAVEALEEAYKRGETDEFVIPTVITDAEGKPAGTVEAGDSIIFFNFRPDRARQLTYAFCVEDFKGFSRRKGFIPVHYVCMTQYDEKVKDARIAYKPQSLKNIFAEVISNAGLKQFRIAETEKYAHVTFFFNGGVEKPFPGEDRLLIPSPKVPTYDMKPEMSAYEVTGEVIKKINEGIYDVIIMNYANPDMVGHTGVFEAAVKAIETVDECIGRVVEAVQKKNGIVIITGDHGNAEKMVDYETGEAHTAHTSDPVPFILISDRSYRLRPGILADVAPTMLELLGIEKPAEMTGRSLIEERL
ncbi:2,3-bisphosphoglycerate-independent phosphoglycerate mutase [Thermosediminibacter litoriperuensis]|uniref:2,3-bisphosphoglycerate-independent phosphoglycerate mutase n=1 Tax=Thermosediminibacter litoriperuensis TaxID=291989 RepID=A0A5S5AP75_9FIRM|nr:2,3-bisphosphoglycerate-independent phosphoglycerate mutase [Thermosediminibacter litoriperuensis]TYP53271.1 phosphoglycerate mutase [Thermosediminibacter litoriperuensis]